MLQKRGAGGCAELAANAAAVYRHAAQNKLCCGSGYGQNAVRAFYGSAADVDRRAYYFVRCKLVDEHGDAEYIRQRVQRAYLMKMYILNGTAMHTALSIGEERVYRFRIGYNGAVSLGMIEKCEYLAYGCMMVVMMPGIAVPVRLFALFTAVDADAYVRAGYAAFTVRRGRDYGASGQRAVQTGEETVPVRMQLRQRPHEHIAGCAHRAVEIERFHRLLVLAFVSIFISSKYTESALKSSRSCACASPSWSAVNCSRAELPLVRTRKSVYPREKR